MSGVRKTFCTVVSNGAGGSSSPRKYGISGCIPAETSSVERSSARGISEAEGRNVWPLDSKKWRYPARSSAVVFTAEILRAVEFGTPRPVRASGGGWAGLLCENPVLDSVRADLPCLRQGAPRRVSVLPVLWGRARRATAARARGAQDRLRPLLRPGRLHRRLRTAGPRGRARPHPSLPRPPAPGDRALRGHGGEVRRRRGDGRLRRSGRARGRRRAGGA